MKSHFFFRSGSMGKQRTPKQILDGAGNLVSQVNSLLVSTANPSDDTSLSIRLSMVKVCILKLIKRKEKHF